MLRILLLLSLAGVGSPVLADDVLSDRVDSVSVTVYRAPGRGEGGIDPNWPGGYALITETRTVTLPRGESTIRFEGVAEGLMPETALLTGLPDGVREKNRDARLLSPSGLVDAYLKRSVTLRRTDRATGKTVEQDAIISAGPMGGVIVQTAQGYEALGCSGLPERMLYPGRPQDLSARPTLSVIAQSDRPVTVTVQLVYLAEGFDWAANYVADMQDGATALDLMAWLTVANGGVTSFADAQLNVIAGQPNKAERTEQARPVGGALYLQCWPMDITSTHPTWELFPVEMRPPDMMAMDEGLGDIIVSAQRRGEVLQSAPMAVAAITSRVIAEQEDLGDLKFYRVPVAVTVAAKSQKQVALMRQPHVKAERLYAATLDYRDGAGQSRPMTLRVRLQNRKADGLGLPMPSGGVALFETVDGARLLAGEAEISDKAIGERIDYDIASSADVRITARRTAKRTKGSSWAITVSNARPFVVTVEIMIQQAIDPRPNAMERRGESWVWRTAVAANDSASYSFRTKD